MTWVAHDIRDSVVDFIAHWSAFTELAAARFVRWIGISPRKFLHWPTRYGKTNEHNALIPRDHWLLVWEKKAIIAFHLLHPLEGYRRITFMMLDAGVVALSPASVYRVLRAAGLIEGRAAKPSKKRQRLPPASGPARPLAHRLLLSQYRRHLLLSGWLLALHPRLGHFP